MAQLPAVTFPGFLRRLLLGTTALLPAAVAQAQAPNAVPTGGQVTAGQASITQSGTHTQVNQGSNRAVVDWQRFDVGRNSTVNFAQPNAQSWTLNRVHTPDPSLIAGRITANGGVAIVNQSGVVFTPGSQVNVGSLIASTANITNQNFMAGRMEFNERGRDGARVENHGSITVADRGLAALVGPGAANTGTIRARLGTAIVAGAESFRLDLAGDGMLSLEVTESVRRTANGNAALVTNSGVIEAQGGQVILSAHAASGLVESVVRNTGRVSGRNVTVTGQGGNVDIAAGSVTARGGSVSITAPDAAVVVGPQARVSASSRQGGGQVQLGGATTSAVRVEGRVSARGTGANATGGRVAVQARDSVTVAPTAVVNASGTVGGGTVLLGTTGVGRAQTMARETRVESGAVVRADAVTSGNGGVVVVNSAESTVMSGTLSARGGSVGGDGGFVEVSAMRNILLNGSILLSAPNGAVGTFLLDPVNIIIRAGAAGAGEDAVAVPGAGDFSFTANTGGNLDAVITTAQLNASGGNIILQAQNNISVQDAVNKAQGNLTLIADTGTITISAGLTTAGGLLTLTATAGAITTTANVSGVGVTMNAGLGITLGGAVAGNAGAVNITAAGNLNVNAAVSSTGGAVNLTSTGGSIIQAATGTVTATGQTITLQSNTITLGAALNAGAGGTVVLTRQTAGSMSIGAGGDTALAAADLQTHVTAGTLRLATTGTVTVAENFTSPAATLQLNGTAGATVDGGVTVNGAGLTLVQNQSGSLTNDGTITTVAGLAQASTFLTNTGTITGNATGGTTLTNSGSITGNATASNGLLDNQAGGTIGGNAVSTLAAITNAGTITGSVTAQTDVTNQVGGTLNGAAITATTGNVLNSGSISSAAALTITAGGNITQNGTLSAGANAVNLHADGAISGTAGVVGTTLTVRGAAGGVASRAGSLNLTTGNTIATLDARTNNATLTFGQTAAFTVTQADAGTGNVTLRSDGAITRTVGATTGVVANVLTVRGAAGDAASRAGSLNLTDGATVTGNAIGVLDARTNNAALTYGQVAAFTVTQADAGTGNVTLRSDGAITRTLAAPTGVVANQLIIRGASGDAASRAGSLNLTDGATVTGNAITTLDARTNNAALTYGQTGAFSVAQADAGTGNVTLRSDGAISRTVGATTGVVANQLIIRGAAGDAASRAGSLSLTDGATVAGNAISVLDARTNNAALTYGQTAGFTVTQADAGTGNVTLRSDGAITRAAGATAGIVGTLLTVRGASGDAASRAGSLNLTDGVTVTGNAIAVLDARTNNAALTYGQVAAFTVTQADAGTGDVTLRSDGAITRTVGAATGVVGTLLTVRGAAGDAASRAASLNLTEGVTVTGNAIATLDARTNNAALTYGQTAGFTVAQADAGTGNVTLRSDGAITRAAGATAGVVGTLLTVRGAAGDAASRAGSLNLTEGVTVTGNAIAVLDARTNNAALTYGQTAAFTVTQADAGTGNVTLRSDGAITRTVGATTGVVANQLIIRGAAGDADSRAASLNLTEGVTVTGNAIATLDARTNNAALTYGQTGAFTVTQADAGTGAGAGTSAGAGDVTLRSDGAITRTAGVTTGVVASLLTVRGASGEVATRAGSLNLTEGNVTTGNAIGILNARTNNGVLTYGQATGLEVTQADAGTGNITISTTAATADLTISNEVLGAGVTLTAGRNLLLNAAVTATGAVNLTATAGAFTQGAAGVVTATNQTITVRADAMTIAAALNAGANGIVVLTRQTDGSMSIGAGGDTALAAATLQTRVTAGTLRLATTGTVTVAENFTSPSATLQLNGTAGATVNGGVTVNGADAGLTLLENQVGSLTNNGIITTVTGLVRASTLLNNTGTITGNAGGGSIDNSGSITLNAEAATTLVNSGTIGGSATSGTTLTAGTTLTNSGTITGNATATTGDLDNLVGGTINGASISANGGNVLNNGTISRAGAVTVTASGDITLNGIVSVGANALNLNAGGAISGTSDLTVGTLRVRGFAGGDLTRAGSLNLTASANAIAVLDARTNNAALTYGQVAAFTVTQADAGTGNVTLRSDGAITRTVGAATGVVGTLLTVRGAAGDAASRAASLNLTDGVTVTGNAIATLDARTNNAALTYGQTGAFSVAQADAGTGDVTLRSDGAITRAAGATAGVVGSLLTVRGAAGDAASRAGSLNLTDGVTVTGNAIGVLDARTNNAALTYGQVAAFTVTQADAGTGNVTLRSDGAITRTVGATTGVVANQLIIRGASGDAASRAGSLNLTDGVTVTGNAIAVLDARTNNAALTYGQTAAFTVTQADAGTGNVTLRSDGAITRTVGVTTGVVANQLIIRGAAGDADSRAASLNLTDGATVTGNAIAVLDARTNNAALTYGQVAAFTVTQADAGTGAGAGTSAGAGDVTLRSDGAITRTVGTTTGVVANQLIIRGAAGDAASRAGSLNLTDGVTVTGNVIGVLDARTNNAALTYGQVAAFTVTQADAGTGDVTLRSDGAITRTVGATTGVVASQLIIRGAAGDADSRAASLNLTDGATVTGNAIAVLDARTNNAALTYGQVAAFTVTQADAGTGAGAGTSAGAGNVTLRSDGAITRTAGATTGVVANQLIIRGAAGDADSRAASLNLTDGATVTGNAIAVLDARTNNAALTYGQVAAFTVTQADAGTGAGAGTSAGAGNVTLRSDGAITRTVGATTGVVANQLIIRGAAGDADSRAASLNLTEGVTVTGNAIAVLDARTNNATLTYGQVAAFTVTQADAGTGAGAGTSAGAGDVTLRSDGAITRTVGATTGVVANQLVIRGAAGDVDSRAASLSLTDGVTVTGNAIAVLDARTNNAALTYGQVAAFTVTQADAGTGAGAGTSAGAGNVTLRSDGAITRTLGAATGVVANQLIIRGAAGDAASRAASLNLTDGATVTGNAIAVLDARTNNAALTYGQTAGFTVTQADAGTGNVTLRSDGAITRTVGATTGVVANQLIIRGASGDAASRAGSLNLTDGVTVTGNAVAVLDARTNNAALTYGQTAAFTVTQADAGTGDVTLRSDGAITRTVGAATGVVGTLLTVRGAAGDAASRAASLNLTDGVTVTGNAIATLDARTNNAALTYGQVAAFTVTQADAGTGAGAGTSAGAGNVTLRSDGAITRAAGATAGVVGTLLTVRGAAGDAASRAGSLNLTDGVTVTGNAISVLDARTNNAALTYGQTAAFTVTQADAGTGNVTLRSDGAITRTVGAITGVVANQLIIRGAAGDAASRAGSLNLTDGATVTGNAITTLDARTNNAALTYGQTGAFSVAQADAGTGNVTLRSDGAISRTVGATTGVVANQLIIRGAAGDAASRAGGLSLTDGATVTGNAISVLDARTNNAALTYGQTAAFTVTQADAGTGNVTLRSDGAVTRTVGATTGVVASQLIIRGAVGDAASRAGSLNLTDGVTVTGNAIGILDARTNNAALTYGQVGGFTVTQADAGTGNVTLRSDGAITRTVGATTGVVGTLLTVRGAAGDAASRAGSLNLTDGATVTGNAIGILDARTNNSALTYGQTAGFTVTQADAGTGNVTLRSDGAITRTVGATTGVVANQLIIRGAAGDAASRAGSLNLTDGVTVTGNAITTLDARTNNAALTYGQTAGFTVAQADAGTSNVALRSDGIVTGGTVRATTLSLRGAAGGTTRAGGVNLVTGNAITNLDALTNNSALTFAQTGALNITQAGAGTGAVTLGSDGALTGGNIIGTALTLRGAGLAATRAASVNLTGGNAITSLDALVNNASLAFGQVNGFSVTQANAGTGQVALFSDGAITGTGGVTASMLTLRGAAGGTSRAGSVNLTIGNAVTSLDARTSGALTFGQTGAIIVAQLDTGTGNATLRSDGAISNTGLVNTALLTVRGAAGGSTAAESLTLTGANTIGALDVLVRGALGLNLASGASIQQLGSSAGSVQITANGTLTVTGLVTAAQDMTLRTTSGDVSIIAGGTLSGGRATTLASAGNIVQTGGTLSAGTALTLTAGQDVSITGGTTSAASLGTSTQGVSAGRDFVVAGGNVTLPTVNAVTAGRDLSLRTTGGDTTATGALTAGGNLAVETTGGALTMQGNTVRAGTGTLDLGSSSNLGVFGASLSAGQAMTLRATGSLNSNPSSFTADSISLVSGAGLSFTQATLTATQGLTAAVTGDISFQNSTLRASTTPSDDAAAFRVLRLAATGNLTLRNSSVTADRVEFVSGGAMTTAGSSFNLGTALLLSARGGVGQSNEAATNVTPLNNSRLPLVIYDTRSGIFLTRLPQALTSATTDQPSRTFNAQTWQVPQVNVTPGQLLFGVNDGAPTPPTNAAAGAILINLNAGGLPVFMLMNGGTASGTITAGRLGVYGLPGSTVLPDGRSVNLLGTLGGVAGESAARFGNLGGQPGTQPSPLALDLYRFNNCVLSSVNCVVPTFLQIPTIPLINSVILGIQQPAFDDRDVLLPNVAEKDF
jgi:mucin-19